MTAMAVSTVAKLLCHAASDTCLTERKRKINSKNREDMFPLRQKTISLFLKSFLPRNERVTLIAQSQSHEISDEARRGMEKADG